MRAWKRLKFGLFMHWGPFSQRVPYDGQYPGASWKLDLFAAGALGYWRNSSGGRVCPPQPMVNATCPSRAQMNAYRDSYWGLAGTFNPSGFDAGALMAWAARVGFKYVIPTTKHHDGFAMWPTSAPGSPGQPIYGVSGPGAACRRDLIGEMADAARANNIRFGAYFSKADWHSGDYWLAPQTVKGSTGFPEYTGLNYIASTPEGAARLARFRNFTAAQLAEVVSRYKPDLLWLDAPWMEYDCNDTVGWSPLHTPQGYGCRLDAALGVAGLADGWASTAPGMMVVDRGAMGFEAAGRLNMRPDPYKSGDGWSEAYLTPEGGYGYTADPRVPWETCVTMGPAWAFTNNSYDGNSYRTAGSVIQTLVDVVAKGGNLLLDVGPDEHGQLPAPAVEQLNQVGRWLEVHGEGVYDTTPVWPWVFNLTHTRTPGTSLNVTQLRLARAGNTVYVHVFLEPSEVPAAADANADADADADADANAPCWRLPDELPLPFVVDGGLDATWPQGGVESVALLGEAGNVGFAARDTGLELTGLPTGCLVNSAHVATLAVTFGSGVA